jgi:hypothetical protein
MKLNYFKMLPRQYLLFYFARGPIVSAFSKKYLITTKTQPLINS